MTEPAETPEPHWRPVDPELMRQRLNEIRQEEEHRAIWDSFCENCRERLEANPVWVRELGHEPTGEIEKTFYCSRCVQIDASRRPPGG